MSLHVGLIKMHVPMRDFAYWLPCIARIACPLGFLLHLPVSLHVDVNIPYHVSVFL